MILGLGVEMHVGWSQRRYRTRQASEEVVLGTFQNEYALHLQARDGGLTWEPDVFPESLRDASNAGVVHAHPSALHGHPGR